MYFGSHPTAAMQWTSIANRLLRQQLNSLPHPKPTSMHMKTTQKHATIAHRRQNRRHALKLMTALAVSACGILALDAAYAQSTSSSIFGKAPTDSTVTVHSDNGITRHISPDSKGKYRLPSLLPGTYLVSLEKSGQTVARVQGVPLFASRASEVNFACDNDQCTGSFGR
jgi:Carboxypeptidase regulatory-like domain